MTIHYICYIIIKYFLIKYFLGFVKIVCIPIRRYFNSILIDDLGFFCIILYTFLSFSYTIIGSLLSFFFIILCDFLNFICTIHKEKVYYRLYQGKMRTLLLFQFLKNFLLTYFITHFHPVIPKACHANSRKSRRTWRKFNI